MLDEGAAKLNRVLVKGREKSNLTQDFANGSLYGKNDVKESFKK